MDLDFVVKLLANESPHKSLNIKENLEHSESRCFALVSDWDIEQIFEHSKLLLEGPSKFFIQDGTKGPNCWNEHNVPDNVFLLFIKGVFWLVLIAQVQLAVVFQSVNECIEHYKELLRHGFHVPVRPVFHQWLLIKLQYELEHEFLGAHFEVFMIYVELFKEFLVLFEN